MGYRIVMLTGDVILGTITCLEAEGEQTMCDDEKKNCEGGDKCECGCGCDNECSCGDKGCCGKGCKCGRCCCHSFVREIGKVVIMSAAATAAALLVTHLMNRIMK